MAAMFSQNMMGANPMNPAAGWHPPGGDERGAGPIRRGGGPMGGGAVSRAVRARYDRRQNQRWGGQDGYSNGGGRRGPANRWGWRCRRVQRWVLVKPFRDGQSKSMRILIRCPGAVAVN